MLCALSAAVCAWFAAAEITFTEPAVAEDDTVLFGITSEFSGEPSYTALCAVNLSDEERTAQVLTWYPESMELLSEGSILQIRNRYGSARYNIIDDTCKTERLYPFGSERTPSLSAKTGCAAPYAVSPDGRWYCYIRRTGAVYGELLLVSADTGSSVVLADGAAYCLDTVPVRWSPDSSVLIYEHDGALFFSSPETAFSAVQPEEQFRRIGRGSISAVQWASASDLIYIDRELIYHISAHELYTRALYFPFAEAGTIIGRLSQAFSCKQDMFSISADMSALVIVSEKRHMAYYRLSAGEPMQSKLQAHTFSLDADMFVTAVSVFWTGPARALVWFEIQDTGQSRSVVYEASSATPVTAASFHQVPIPQPARRPAASPDGSLIAFQCGGHLAVYDTELYRVSAEFAEEAVSYIWKDNSSLYVGGSTVIGVWYPAAAAEPSFQPKLLAGAESYGFSQDGNTILAKSNSILYAYDADCGVWRQASEQVIQPRSNYNNSYRVYLGESSDPAFANAIYVRSLRGTPHTALLYAQPGLEGADRRQVALVFDAYDNADGLKYVLCALSHFNLRATFFINGEFIRRFPDSVQAIADQGHECASMFFSAADLTAPGFVVDSGFILRGLARTEDEYYACTGRELALLWHAPLYRTTAAIRAAGEAAGYGYVERSVIPGDTVTFETAVSEPGSYLPALHIIERIIDNLSDGAVIPLSVGIGGGVRGDYVYEYLPLLIAAVIAAGYDIVPVSALGR